MLSSGDLQMHFSPLFRDAILGWKVRTLMVSPSLMELQVHDSIFGLLLLLSMKLLPAITLSTSVRAQTLTSTGHTKFHYSLETTISATLVILDPAGMVLHTRMILCGMVRGVALPMPAANSTTLLGSAQHCHNPLLMILS